MNLFSTICSLFQERSCFRCGVMTANAKVLYAAFMAKNLYIGMDEVIQHHAHTFEKSDLNFHF